VKRICGGFRECRAAQITAKANVDTAALELIGVELPGVVEDGMSGRNGQRKPGTARGSPRRSRTAKAPHISRGAVKLRCACEWGAWGRVSDDGPDNITWTGARAPGVGGVFPPHGGALSSPWPGSVRDNRSRPRDARRRRQTRRRSANAGSRLKLIDVSGRPRLIRQPSSRTGENPLSG